jgi:hypothetical protein
MKPHGRYLLPVLLLAAGCPTGNTKNPDGAPSTVATESTDIVEAIYDGALKGGWQETGSLPRELGSGAATIHFDAGGEWTLSHATLDGHFGALLFRTKEPANEGEFIEVHLGSGDGHAFPSVKLKPDHTTSLADGWTQVRVPAGDLDPDGASFDRIVFKTFRPLTSGESIVFDKIALAQAPAAGGGGAGGGGASGSGVPGVAGGKPVRIHVSCDAKPFKISPLIYGVAHGEDGWWRLGVVERRWGGNPNSRYNWEKNVNSAASDWYFENRGTEAYTKFLADDAAHAVVAALTIPMLGWVAKDASSYSFPVSVFGAQKSVDPYKNDAGNGVDPAGNNIKPGPQTRTSIEAPPEWAKRWVATIRAADAKTGKRSVGEYILDNEPNLWSTTQRDVHPDPMSYDELLDRSLQYGAAIREADPDATIAGPAEWGWPNYFDSAKDTLGKTQADRQAHGGVSLVEWYLRKMREREQSTGTRILDVLDLHYYPQANNVYGGGAGGSDRATQLLRLRATRSLWDSSYVDESWINQSVRLLPRMREWVDKNYPGRGISIGEWNFGGEKDITGALATAETLGRFAQYGVASAFYWTAPPPGSPSGSGFVAYRNFDGKGGRFLDEFVPTSAVEGASVFVSRDGDGKHLVIVAINLMPDTAVSAELDVASCGAVASQQSYVYADGSPAFTAAPATQAAGSTVKQGLAPWSITVIDAHLR